MARYTVILAKDAEKAIADAVVREINRKIRNINIRRIETRSKKIVRSSITKTRTYKSLTNADGLLLKHFGLENPQEKLEEILSYIEDTIEVRFTQGRRSQGNTILKSSIIISILKGGVLQLLELGAAIQENSFSQNPEAPDSIPWLDWLLTQGESIIITGYDIALDDYNTPPSRSGGALMFKQKSGGWHVPINLAGTVRNNFITEALKTAEAEILEVMMTEIMKAIE